MSQKKGPPLHQNREKWVPERADKHSSMREKVERDLAQPGGGVCQKCREVIQWKKDYGKYKPLRAPAKCTHCNQRVITHAYHMLCLGCANFKNVCAKCGEDRPLHEEDPFDGKPKPPSPDELALMNERQRRTAIRKYEKALDDEKAAKRAALQGITVEELRQREAAEREARGQPIAELVQDVDKMLHPKLFRAAPPPTAPPVAPAPPRPTATTAESMYASLEKMGQPASLCAPVDASDQARWSDRDNEGRTDDEDADLLNMESTRLGNQSRVAAAKASVPVAKTGRKSKASVINDDDDAAVEAVEAEAASDEDEDDDDDDDDDEDDDEEEEDEEEDADEQEQTLREQLASLSHSVGAAALVGQRYPHVTAASLQVAELGFDALVERLSCEGEAAAAKADAMTDRVATVLERASAIFGDAADATAALAMALEVRFYLLSCGEEAAAGAEAEAIALVS